MEQLQGLAQSQYGSQVSEFCMADEKYTSQVAQTVEATGDLLHNTPSGLIYYIITVGSLLGVLYFGVNRIENGLNKIDIQLNHIDTDLQKMTEGIEESLADVKPVKIYSRELHRRDSDSRKD